jgi:hypothetical protein
MAQAFKNLILGYDRLLHKYPYTTNMVTAGTLSALSDITCQCFLKKNPNDPHDWRRTFQMSILSVFYTPITRVWYNVLPKMADRLVTNKKFIPYVITALDEVIYSPIWIASWLYLAKYLDTRDNQLSIANMKEKFAKFMVTGWFVWPIATFITFSAITPVYRVVFMNSVSFGWGLYRSWLQYKPIESVQQQNVL